MNKKEKLQKKLEEEKELKEQELLKNIDEINLKKAMKMPNELKSEKRKNLLISSVYILSIAFYFFTIYMGKINIENSSYIIDIYVLSAILTILSIVFFEKGYYKDNEKTFLTGAEFLVLGFFTIYTLKINDNLEGLMYALIIAFIIFAIYYISKYIYLRHRIQKKYKENISDARKIIKEGSVN